MLNQLTEGVGKAFVFNRIRPGLRDYFLKAGILDVPYSLFGWLFWISILPVAIIFMTKGWTFILSLNQGLVLEFLLASLIWMVVHFTVIAGLLLVTYIYLDLKIYDRTKKMEAVLPDYLRMVSENLKGGMPFERALWSSMRPEFGILSSEIRLAAKKVITGQEVGEALKSFAQKYDSPIMNRSFNLIIEGLKGGGQVAYIIDGVIDTIEETRDLKSEMVATNLSFVIFISIIILIVTPGLFTLSFQFLTVLGDIGEKVGSAGGSGFESRLPIDLGGLSIDPNVFKIFSINALLIISLFASMMISIIQKGNIKGGVKYIPMLMLGSYVMYNLMMAMANAVFSGFLG